MKKYKHSQFNAGWWSCLCSMAQRDQRLSGMSAYLMEVMRDAGVTREEAEYVLDHNIVTDNRLKNILKEYIENVCKR